MALPSFVEKIGRFQVVGELGRGAFGAVYEVRDPATGEALALKLFSRASDGATAVERFRREPSLLGRADHPNVVRVHAAGDHLGLPYFVMDLVRGVALDRALAERGRFPWAEACAIGRKIALALDHIHRAGLVHRDVKPANVLLDVNGEPRLIDLSLALDTLRATRLTRSGELVGTLRYMALEQLDGRTEDAVAATDIFGLGAVVYEMLTGADPFPAPTLDERVRALAATRPQPPDRLVSDVPARVSSLVQRMLEGEPSKRPRSAAAVAEELAAAIDPASQDPQARVSTVPAPLPTPALTVPAPRPADKLGRYEIVSVLGRGGMGVVFKARSPEGAEVAIKLLKRPTASALARFERERRLLATIGESEGFVPLLESLETAHGPALVMPLVSGGSLGDRLKKGPLSIDEAIALGRTLATALGAVHARGIVHRDLKPENVLYDTSAPRSTQGGSPLVADLGIAKHFDHDVPGASRSVGLTKTGVLMGTAGYMAPEQMANAKDVGPAADVFALGAILYECIAGRPAFAGESAIDVLAAVDEQRFEPLRRARRETPAWLASVVERTLARDPARRFPDARALAQALARGRSKFPGARAAALGAVVAIVGAVLLLRSSAPDVDRAPPGDRTSSGERSPSRDAPLSSGAQPTPAPVFPEPCRGFLKSAHAHLVGVSGSYPWHLPDRVRGLALSPDGTRVLAVSDERLFLIEIATGRDLRTFEGLDSTIQAVAFSPDGRRALAASTPRTGESRRSGSPGATPALALWDVETGTLLRRFGESKDGYTALAFLPGGARAVTGPRKGRLEVWDLETGAATPLCPVPDEIEALAISPESDLVVFGARSGALGVYSLATGEVSSLPAAGQCFSLRFVADGHSVLAGSSEGARIIDCRSGTVTSTLTPQRTVVVDADVSPGEGRVLGACGDSTLALWSPAAAKRGDDPLVKTIAGLPAFRFGPVSSSVRFLHEGKHAIVCGPDETVRLFDLASGRCLNGSDGHTSMIVSTAVSPDGKLVATGGLDERICIRDAATLKLVRTIEGLKLGCYSFSFTNDSKSLVAAALASGIEVRDLKTGAVQTLLPTEGWAYGVDVTADGKRALALTTNGTVQFFDLEKKAETGRLIRQWAYGRPRFTPDGTRAVVSTDAGTLVLYDPSAGKVVAESGPVGHAYDLRISPDGRRVLGAGLRATILWEPGGETTLLRGHTEAAHAAAIAPDGKLGATGGIDRTIRLWDLERRIEIDRIDLSTSSDTIGALTFSRDGRSLFVGTARGVLLEFGLDEP